MKTGRPDLKGPVRAGRSKQKITVEGKVATAAQNRKNVIIARLRGGTITECAKAADVSVGWAHRIISAFIVQIESGMVEEMPESPDPTLRWQVARAEEKELNVAQMKKELFPVVKVRQQCEAIAKHLRDAQVALDKQFGQEAGDLVRDALESAKREEATLCG